MATEQIPPLRWDLFTGQPRIKEVLTSAYTSQNLGHAYLFCGPRGVGKFAAALEFGTALLCQSGEAVPCNSCRSCRKVRNYAHPDFRVLFPVELQSTHKDSSGLKEGGWHYLAEQARQWVSDAYQRPTAPGAGSIPVEWIRETNQAILRGPVEGAVSVSIFDSVDLMRKESANAMLKVIEEPPPHTLILLLTDKLQSVLPTLVSRSQLLRFGYLSHEAVVTWLRKRFPDASEDQLQTAAMLGDGSPGRAAEWVAVPAGAQTGQATGFLQACAGQQWEELFEFVDAMRQNGSYEECHVFFTQLCTLVRGLLLQTFKVEQKYISSTFQPERCPVSMTAARAHAIVMSCQQALAALRAHGDTGLVLARFVLMLTEIFHEQEQQAG